MSALGLYALTLASTVSIEAPLVAAFGPRRDTLAALRAAVCVNLASHPPATALAGLAGVDWLLVEVLVVVFEALALRAALGWPARQAWGLSLAANSVTAGLALFLSRL